MTEKSYKGLSEKEYWRGDEQQNLAQSRPLKQQVRSLKNVFTLV